jgi:integrator complex subunit 11
MIYAKVGDAAMVYTGDYNMTSDRHLGAAQIDCLKLDLLITEYSPTSSYKHNFPCDCCLIGFFLIGNVNHAARLC